MLTAIFAGLDLGSIKPLSIPMDRSFSHAQFRLRNSTCNAFVDLGNDVYVHAEASERDQLSLRL